MPQRLHWPLGFIVAAALCALGLDAIGVGGWLRLVLIAVVGIGGGLLAEAALGRK
jgi:hypothetical protein